MFKVSVATLVASNGTTYVVCIDHPDRPLTAKPWDKGRMQVFTSSIEDHANMECKRWVCFFANKDYNYEL